MLSIIIPSRTEKFLNRTIQDILEKATGEIEIIPILDGYDDVKYEPVIDKRVRYVRFPNPIKYERHKRQGINTGVSISDGEFVAWCDAHCCFAKGFDEVLARDCEKKMVMVPRRHRLVPETWTGTSWAKEPIDYEYFMWQHFKKGRLAGYKWDAKTIARKDIPIDDIFTAQGSFFFMTREWFDKCGFMHIKGYTGWGQEGEEVALTTLLNGGRAVVDKNTWYAHMHKGQMHGRMYKWTTVEPSYDYSFNYWVREQKEFFISIIERFGLFPNWKPDWKDIYGHN